MINQGLNHENAEKEREADKRAMLMLDASPLSCFIIKTVDGNNDGNHRVFQAIDCNNAALNLFGFKSKEEAVARFEDIFPDSLKGDDVIDMVMGDTMEALKSGFRSFEYNHYHLDGSLIPCNITLVRVNYMGEDVLACYQQDLRPVKAAMAKERESYTLARKFIDYSPLFIEIWDDEFNLVECNKTALDMFSMKNSDDYTKIFIEHSPIYQPCGTLSSVKIKQVIKKAFEEGNLNTEWLHTGPDGEPLPVDVTYVRLKRGDRHIVVGYNIDLRQIRAAMAKERESYVMAKMFIDSAPFFVEIWDENYNLTECNQTAVKMFNLKSAEEYMRIFSDLSPKYQPCGTPSSEKIKTVIKTAFETGGTRTEWMHIAPDGGPLPVDVTYVRLKRGNRHIVVGYNMDLRKINAAMDKVKQAEERTQILLDASPIASISLDENLQAIDFNNAALDLFVKEPGRSIIETYPDKDFLGCMYDKNCYQHGSCSREKCAVRKFFLNNHRYIFKGYEDDSEAVEEMLGEFCMEARILGLKTDEYTAATLYGKSVPCQITVVSVSYGGTQGYALYLRDLRAEKLRVRAEEANKAKSSFLSTMSHEIRTPMNAIIGITEIQLMNDDINSEIKNAFEMIYASGDLLLGIINDILDLSKIEAGKLNIVVERYEIASFISDTAQLNMMRIGSKPIEFEINADENLPTYVMGDELRVKQILNNLLSNAFKYTEDGTVLLDISFKENVINQEEIILIVKVTDTGVGMSNEQINQLFDEFSRFNEEANRETEGTGLGMSITQNLVKLMNGEILVESKPGKGSVFTVLIPQGKVSKDQIGKEMADNLKEFRSGSRAQMRRVQITRKPMPYGSVLIVDDVETNIYVAKGLLMPYQIKTDSASSGKETIKKVQDGETYDIIFMDHMMPEMDGVETTRLLRIIGYDKPIVALTANAVSGQAEVFLNNGFDDYISKPIDVRHLNMILNKYVRYKHLPDVVNEAEQSFGTKQPGFESSADIDSKFAEIFLRDADKSLETLAKLEGKLSKLAPDELRTYTIHVHGMKSALANMKNKELSDLAARLESLGRNEDFAEIAAKTPGFVNQLKDFVTELSPEEPEEAGEGEIIEEDLTYLHEKLEAIKASCEDYDETSAESAVAELQERKWAKPTNELISNISIFLLRSDFDEIVELIDNFAG